MEECQHSEILRVETYKCMTIEPSELRTYSVSSPVQFQFVTGEGLSVCL